MERKREILCERRAPTETCGTPKFSSGPVKCSTLYDEYVGMDLRQFSGFVPVLAIMGCFFFWMRHRPKWKGNHPVKQRLLRAPGESLRIRIGEINEKLMLLIFAITGTGGFLGYYTDLAGKLSESLRFQYLAAFWAAALLILTSLTAWLVHTYRLRLDYELGESGERAVGEETNKLMRFGCHVFHDLVVENWNIDHVVVAPSGVYVIETKAYRKQKTHGDDFYKVRFDGKALHFPGWTETRSLRQAQRNAAYLSEELSKLLGEPVQVRPVLALPGWMVSREGKGTVAVLNHREFQSCIVQKSQEKLSLNKVERIAAILDERCRTIEF